MITKSKGEGNGSTKQQEKEQSRIFEIDLLAEQRRVGIHIDLGIDVCDDLLY